PSFVAVSGNGDLRLDARSKPSLRHVEQKTGRFDNRKRGAQNLAMPLAVRLPFIIVSSVAYFGLAILGRGGVRAVFSWPALIGLSVAFFTLVVVALFAGGSLSPGVREDRSNRWVIAAFVLIGLLHSFLPAWTDRQEIWTLDGNAVRWLGVALFAAGGALRVWLGFVLGRRLTRLGALHTP